MAHERLVRRAQPWLGTIVEIAAPPISAHLIDGAFEKVAGIHRSMSFHSEASDLAALRRCAPGERVKVSRDTINVLREARRLFDQTGGLFDVTVASELVEWGFLPVPAGWTSGAVAGAGKDIEIIDDLTVRLRRRLLIDLGGIAKGYAVDAAINYLKDSGARAGIVNAGGDLRVFGDVPFPITLRAADWSGATDQITIENAAMATSANEHSRRFVDGRPCSPHVGKNRETMLFKGSFCFFARCAMNADALTNVAISDATLAAKIAPEFGAELLYSP